MLQRALGNLLDNAVLCGERVQVRLESVLNMAQVEIRDFGSGLGLDISRNIVLSHGGEISLYNHAEGGLVALVLLPAIAP